jgi:uncharacterized protein YjdB
MFSSPGRKRLTAFAACSAAAATRAVLALTILSCGSDSNPTGPTSNTPVASVTIEMDTVFIGRSTQATATVRDAAGDVLPGRAVTWASDRPDVATVSASGVVTGVEQGVLGGSGLFEITATSGGVAGRKLMQLIGPIVEAELFFGSTQIFSFSTPTLAIGQIVQATITLVDVFMHDLTAGHAITWSSSNPSVATVTSTGVVTTVAPGTAKITGASGGISGSGTLTVTPPVASVSLTPSSIAVEVGHHSYPTATLRDASGTIFTGPEVTWVSANPAIATVAEAYGYVAIVTGIAVGTTTVTASSEGKFFSATVTVTPTTQMVINFTSPVLTNEFKIAIDDGTSTSVISPTVYSVKGTATTSGSLTVDYPAGTYRVRVIAIDTRDDGFYLPYTLPPCTSPGSCVFRFSAFLIAASGKADAVVVPPNQRTNITVSLAQPSVQINAPDSVAAGQGFSITWTYTDPGAALDGQSLGEVRYSATPFSDTSSTSSYSRSPAVVTRLNATTYSFTASLTAPAAPAMIFFQVKAESFEAETYTPPSPPDSQPYDLFAYYLDPSTRRGESLKTIQVK